MDRAEPGAEARNKLLSVMVPAGWELGALPSPDGAASHVSPPFPAEILWRLLEAAGRNRIVPLVETLDPPAIGDEFTALMSAASGIVIGGDIRLVDLLWPHPDALWRGDVARRLAQLSRNGGMPAFVLAYADEVGGHVATGKGAAPLRTVEEITVLGDAAGPYLLLVACGLDGSGRARPLRAVAQPVLAGQRFVPVWSDLERDVWLALVHLQERLDAFGVDMTAERILAKGTGRSARELDIGIIVRRRGETGKRLAIAFGSDPGLSADIGGDDVFRLDRQRWTDLSFLAWLERHLLGL